MTVRPIADEELHAFIDGELAADRAEALHAAARADHNLAARIAAYRADTRRLAAAFGPIAEAPIPDAWRARIEAATVADMRPVPLPRTAAWRRAPAFAMALAACLALLALTALLRPAAPADTILAEATAARQDTLPALLRLAGDTLQNRPMRDAKLAQAVGLQLHVPDLSALHWHLAEMDTYAHAAALRYRNDTGQHLTVYVRPSAGAPRFDLLREGAIRTCIWQDEVVGAVMTGDMSAGQMMRVASAAYLALSL